MKGVDRGIKNNFKILKTKVCKNFFGHPVYEILFSKNIIAISGIL